MSETDGHTPTVVSGTQKVEAITAISTFGKFTNIRGGTDVGEDGSLIREAKNLVQLGKQVHV